MAFETAQYDYRKEKKEVKQNTAYNGVRFFFLFLSFFLFLFSFFLMLSVHHCQYNRPVHYQEYVI